MNYYLSRWEWVTQDGESLWQAPQNAVGLLDLRSIPQMSLAGGSPQGWGLFAYPNPVSGLSYSLGTGFLTNAIKNGIRNRLGIPTALQANDVLSALWELLVQHADPTGQLRWKPLLPGADGKLKLYLGGHSLVREETYSPSQHPLVLETLREDYRSLRQEFQAIGSDHYRRVLSALVAQYGRFGLTWRDFIPTDLPQETPLPHGTTITESFNTADGDILGPNLSWTETQNDIDIVSNEAKAITAGAAVCVARADTDLATDDHYVQASVTTTGTSTRDVAVGARKDSTTTATYYRFLASFGSDTVAIAKVVSGTPTDLITPVAYAFTEGTYYLLKGSANGSALEVLVDGVSKATVTDTAITGNLRTLIRGRTPCRWDNFEAGDLGVTYTQDVLSRAGARADFTIAVTMGVTSGARAGAIARPTLQQALTLTELARVGATAFPSFPAGLIFVISMGATSGAKAPFTLAEALTLTAVARAGGRAYPSLFQILTLTELARVGARALPSLTQTLTVTGLARAGASASLTTGLLFLITEMAKAGPKANPALAQVLTLSELARTGTRANPSLAQVLTLSPLARAGAHARPVTGLLFIISTSARSQARAIPSTTANLLLQPTALARTLAIPTLAQVLAISASARAGARANTTLQQALTLAVSARAGARADYLASILYLILASATSRARAPYLLSLVSTIVTSAVVQAHAELDDVDIEGEIYSKAAAEELGGQVKYRV